MDGHPRATCAFCGERIGVYEPIMVVTETGERHSSLAGEPGLRENSGPMLHAACAWFHSADSHPEPVGWLQHR